MSWQQLLRYFSAAWFADVAPVRADAQAACMLQVVTEPVAGAVQAAATHLEALQLELCASERVDLNWVSAKYRAGTTITEKDNRRITRPLLRMKPVRLCEQTTLLPGSRRLYLVRSAFVGLKQFFLNTASPDQSAAHLCVDHPAVTPVLTATARIQLPDALPPSFKGSAVRYSYQLEARANFAPQSWKGATPTSTAQSSDVHSQPSTPSIDTRPRSAQTSTITANTSPHLVRYSSSSSLKLSRGREAVGQQHRKGPGIVHVKAPVHLWPLVSLMPLAVCPGIKSLITHACLISLDCTLCQMSAG